MVSDIGFPPQHFVQNYSWDRLGTASGYPIERVEEFLNRLLASLAPFFPFPTIVSSLIIFCQFPSK
jgi:hypothetical protein